MSRFLVLAASLAGLLAACAEVGPPITAELYVQIDTMPADPTTAVLRPLAAHHRVDRHELFREAIFVMEKHPDQAPPFGLLALQAGPLRGTDAFGSVTLRRGSDRHGRLAGRVIVRLSSQWGCIWRQDFVGRCDGRPGDKPRHQAGDGGRSEGVQAA